MGRRGTKPKPTTIKIFNGNPGKRPLNKNEPEPDKLVADPKPPAWLGKVGAKKWKELVPQLRRTGLLTKLDTDVLSAYCDAWNELAECQAALAKDGDYNTLESGFVQLHPAVGRMHKALERIRKLATEFGMTPSSRASLDIGKDKPKGVLNKYVD